MATVSKLGGTGNLSSQGTADAPYSEVKGTLRYKNLHIRH